MSSTSPVQINALEIQNVKKIKAVKIDCTGEALTVIGGRNGQGKTSVLDSIAFALGGKRYEPSNLKREGSIGNPEINLTLSNGLIVSRKGKNASLTVTDPSGERGGQQLLNSFVSQLAIDLPRFLNATESEQARMLLEILGIGEELGKLEREEKALYDKRHTVGQYKDSKKKHANELPSYADVPDQLISVSEQIQAYQDVLRRNGENQAKREHLSQLNSAKTRGLEKLDELLDEVASVKEGLERLDREIATASKTTEQLKDESTKELEERIQNAEEINAKVTANLDKQKAIDDASQYEQEYIQLTEQIEGIRKSRLDLLEGASLPLPGLTVESGALIYNGRKWDCMSGSEQLRVGTAIVRKLNPNCGFVLLDKAEQFDLQTLKEFGQWLAKEGLQAIATRVSSGDECSILIEDGMVEGEEAFLPTEAPAPKFSPGTF